MKLALLDFLRRWWLGFAALFIVHFFLERYHEAYRREMQHFIDQVLQQKPNLSIGARDGKRALVLAEAALESVKTKRFVRIPE